MLTRLIRLKELAHTDLVVGSFHVGQNHVTELVVARHPTPVVGCLPVGDDSGHDLVILALAWRARVPTRLFLRLRGLLLIIAES